MYDMPGLVELEASQSVREKIFRLKLLSNIQLCIYIHFAPSRLPSVVQSVWGTNRNICYKIFISSQSKDSRQEPAANQNELILLKGDVWAAAQTG